MMHKLFCCLLLWLAAAELHAQDINCKIDLTYDRVQNVDPKVFQSLKRSLTEFVNNRKWTSDNFKPGEKIECSFLLNLTEKTADNVYRATLNIQSSRPVYNSGYYSSMVNFVDRDIVFRFDESQTLQFDDNRISGADAQSANLTAIVAYYVYLIIGFDYDSFAPRGGDEFFKKAQNIVNNAPEEGKVIKGWKAAEGNRNRYWLIDQILNPRFEAFRPLYYNYHRKGLDVMSSKPEEGRKVIMESIPVLTKINNDNPTSILMQFFFNAKSGEFANTLAQTPQADRKDYVDQLCKMDVPNTARYRSIK